jgi:hypothetical protein
MDPEVFLALGAATIVIALSTYAYDDYVAKGWDIGDRMATRVGLGRALQLLMADGLIPQRFSIQKFDGTHIHISVEEKDGQKYFRAWHKNLYPPGTLWWGYIPFGYRFLDGSEIVEDIPVGTVPVHSWPTGENNDK